MKLSRVFLSLVLVVVFGIALLPCAAQAQDETVSPSVTVADQVVLDSYVRVAEINYDAPGFIVIHADNGEGAPGPVIGWRQLSVGLNTNVEVWIDATQATSTLYAMLHMDTGEVGVYEFGTVDGADAPVSDAAGNVVTPAFHAAVLNAKDQLANQDATFTAAAVTVDAGAWLVIHSDADGQPGPVLGQTLLEAGTTTDVSVDLATDGLTDVLWPMLHVDTGEVGVYEFGTVEGADAPLVVNDAVATTPIWTVPHVRALPQVVTYSDVVLETMEAIEAPTFTVASVLALEPGFIVIHSEADGQPGPVAGYAPVPAGLTENIVVELDPTAVTPNLWPMLHSDTGEAGVYEFGTVDGADLPVSVNDEVVTFQVLAAANINYAGEYLDEYTLYFDTILADSPTWLVIHKDDGTGNLGDSIGERLLVPGLNRDVIISLDPDETTPILFPMLHHDTGTLNIYEFGSVANADLPVRVGGVIIKGTFAPTN